MSLNICSIYRISDVWKESDWYSNLENDGKFIADLIFKYHRYFSTQDKKYRLIVRSLKVIILLLSMSSTIVLGLNTIIDMNSQVIICLILSSLITFVTAISSYFNFEEYWIRNISIHIQLNIIRDSFILEVEGGSLDHVRIKYYEDELTDIQKNNITYWEKAIKKI